jgi:hypothetical protein
MRSVSSQPTFPRQELGSSLFNIVLSEIRALNCDTLSESSGSEPPKPLSAPRASNGSHVSKGKMVRRAQAVSEKRKMKLRNEPSYLL